MKPEVDRPPSPPSKQQPSDPVKTSEPQTTTQTKLPEEVPKNLPAKDHTGTCPVAPKEDMHAHAKPLGAPVVTRSRRVVMPPVHFQWLVNAIPDRDIHQYLISTKSLIGQRHLAACYHNCFLLPFFPMEGEMWHYHISYAFITQLLVLCNLNPYTCV